MKKLLSFATLILFCNTASADITNPMEITEEDGSPSQFAPFKLKFQDGTMSISNDGSVLIGGTTSDPTYNTVTVQDEAYDATGWNSDLSVPTKNAVRDKIETLSVGSSGWQTSSNVVHLLVTGDTVTIGSPTGLGKFAVDGDADETQFLVQGFSTQSNKLIIAETSDGTDRFTVSADGTVSIVGTGPSHLTVGGGTATARISADTTGTDTYIEFSSGGATFSHDISSDTLTVDTEVYGSAWDGNNTVPTKDAVYDKVETVSGGSGKVFISFPVQSAKLSNDSTVRIDAGTPGSNLYNVWSLRFNDGTNLPNSNIAIWTGRMDDNYAAGALTAKINNFMLSSDSTSTANGNVTYGVSIWALTSGDSASVMTESYDTENSATKVVASVMSRDQTISIPLTNADSIAAGDWFAVKLRRAGNDTITGDSCVTAFSIVES